MRTGGAARAVVVSLLVSAFGARPAQAHMMPAQQGTLNLLDDAVFAVLSLPLAAAGDVDDDGDGQLSAPELARHDAGLRADVARRVRLLDGDHPGRLEFLQVNVESDGASGGAAAPATAAHLLVLLKVRFAAPPTALRVESDFWAAAGAQQLTLRAVRGAAQETTVLTPARRSHRFFRAAPPVRGAGGAALLLVASLLLVAALAKAARAVTTRACRR